MNVNAEYGMEKSLSAGEGFRVRNVGARPYITFYLPFRFLEVLILF